MASSCQSCVDACTDVCLSGHVARGSIRTTDPTACLASDERLATFRFDLTVNNCSERTINNFMPRLDLNNVFLAEGGAVCSPSRVTSALRVTASIGEANGLYDGTERTALLCHTVPLPPGCSTFSVYLTDPHLNAAALQRALFSVKGHVKCAPCDVDACHKPLAPQCVALHKSVALNCDCLPLETEASARRIRYVRCGNGNFSFEEPVTAGETVVTPPFWVREGTGVVGVQLNGGNPSGQVIANVNGTQWAFMNGLGFGDASGLYQDLCYTYEAGRQYSLTVGVAARSGAGQPTAGAAVIQLRRASDNSVLATISAPFNLINTATFTNFTVTYTPSAGAAEVGDLVRIAINTNTGNLQWLFDNVRVAPAAPLALPVAQQNGASWTTAYVGATGLQQAVNTATAGEQVWVGEGVYRFTSGNVQVPSGVKVFGGFHVGDTALCQRTLHVEGGSNSVITTQGSSASFPDDLIAMTLVDARTVFDGFTISGIVDTFSDQRDLFVLDNGAARIRNLAVRDNIYAGGFQWRMFGSALDAVICNCLWENNNNDLACTGITQSFTGGVGRSTLVNCTFRRNIAVGGQGAAICVQENGGNLTAINCVFEDNFDLSGTVTVISFNVTTQQQTANLQSCTFVGNVPTSVLAARFGTGPARANVLNSIIVSNAPATNFSTPGTGLITVQQSILSDATPFNAQVEDLGGNKVGITQAQAFGGDGSTAPLLAPGAVAINCGTNAPLVVGTDRANRPRVAKGRVDVGAFELNC